MKISIKAQNFPIRLSLFIPLWLIPGRRLQKKIGISSDLPGIRKCLKRMKQVHGSIVLADIRSAGGDCVKIIL